VAYSVGSAPPQTGVAAGVGLFVLLHAFANGCTAMTGVEAISNGIPAFEPPEADNAAKTLLIMAAISPDDVPRHQPARRGTARRAA